MRTNIMKNSRLQASVLTLGLLLATGTTFAASTTVNLTAQRARTTFPDGTTVPMWGMCSTDTAGAVSLGGATLTGGACTTTVANWAPGPIITIPYDAAGTSLTINLINNLPTPTSLVILGQLGGGVGQPNKEPSPVHLPSEVSWPGTPEVGGPVFTPPAQGLRARSFSPEAAANGGTQTYTWANLKPGTYIYETGSHPSIQAPMGMYGLLVVTTAPTATLPGAAYPGINYDGEAALLFSDVDPVLNTAVEQAATLSAGCPALTGVCTGVINEANYPQAVNFTPIYFLINGRSFDPTTLQTNAFSIPATAATGNVLMRLANAGLRNYVPATLGLPMAVVAEDGNVLPGNPKVKSQLLLPAGKTLDVVVHPAKDPLNAAMYQAAAYGIFDRQLSLSANKQSGGMQAILQIAGGALPAALQCAANADSYVMGLTSTTFSANVLSNDRGISAVAISAVAANGVVTLNDNGSFTYTPTAAPITADSFSYTGLCAATGLSYTGTVALNVAAVGGIPAANADTFSSKIAKILKVKAPGVLVNDTDPTGYKLSAAIVNGSASAGLAVILNPDGSFTAQPAVAPTVATTYTFSYNAVNEQLTASTPVTVTLNFSPARGLQVSVIDATDRTLPPLQDYSWVIEEDTTYYHDPLTPAGTGVGGVPPQSLTTNFHKSYTPLVATGCTGPRSCGDANIVNGQPIITQVRVLPSDVVLDPTKRYYISILPGDALDGDPDVPGSFGHTMAGGSIAAGQTAVTVLASRNPLPAAQMSVLIFEDKGPTSGTIDVGESGLGGFTIRLLDTRGSVGDGAGLMSTDLSGMPLTNGLAGTPGPNGVDLCPIPLPTGTVSTCPALDSAGQPSKFAGMAVIKNIPPGRYEVVALPGVDRLSAGEAWIQVTTIEGGPVTDTFIKPGEPGYWQEFGIPGFHSAMGFVRPAAVAAVNAALGATNTVTGKISSLHMDRPPGALLNDSCATTPADAGYFDDPTCRATLASTTCLVSINQNITGANISYGVCDQNGNFSLTGIPSGTHELVIWDQWLDQIIAKKAVTVPANAANQTIAMGTIPVFDWFTRIEQTAYLDLNKNGLREDGEPGLPIVPLNLRFRSGAIMQALPTDVAGDGGSNEIFPLFNWYVMEADTLRHKGTGVHVIYDAGGKPDVTGPYAGVVNSTETTPLPANLQVPGATYVAGKTERIDPPSVTTEGVQSYINQTTIFEWGKVPFEPGENGGIAGMVYYASTRANDDPRTQVQLLWEPGVPRVTVNLYAKTTNADGTQSLVLVDTTTSTSWDDGVNNLHCPGDPLSDPFVTSTLGAENQFKCYDGQHSFNQAQPAVYDGRYNFPSAAYIAAHPITDPVELAKAPKDRKLVSLPTGKYVVEVVLADGYEIVKEEDKNVLNGDAWLTPDATNQFAGLGNIFVFPDQATVNNSVNPGSGAMFPACVGTLHRVPDYLTLFPEGGNVSPFFGQDRPLCDRKEVAVVDQQVTKADFQVFTPTPLAAHYTGIMLNDAAAEFNPIAPSFGEKASLPNAPIAFRDHNGVELARVYNDKYGNFNGLLPSTYNANVPNPSGYAPNMLTSCMNDPGPIPDPTGAIDPATGQVKMIIDPLYNPMFSNFCYVWPYMPGITTYLDTPVLPVAAFANTTSYTPADCQYPDATPAISRVDSSNGIGPWVREGGGNTLTITALGDVSVLNPQYAGPTALTAPANQPKITRHYGFGAAQGSGSVKLFGNEGDDFINGVNLLNVTWSDTTITGTVPPVLPTGTYQLVITAANGKQTVDTVTVHVVSSGYTPTVVRPAVTGDSLAQPIQNAIDAAVPGALIIVDAGHYPELVVMDKPVRLQGVGAASVVINATKFPNQKLEVWRTRINNDFGLDNQGNDLPGEPLVDPLPGQTIIGGVLQLEPSVLGTEQGAGITVLAKGLRLLPNGTTRRLNATAADCRYSVRNFLCASGARRARIDGISVTGSDAGGGIYVNGWAHNLEISNNRVYGNAGPLNGGIHIGQPYLPGQTLPAVNGGLAYNQRVNVHHNAISMNGMVEGAPGAVAPAANTGSAGAGLSICAGTDNYRVTGNWVCGNYSSSNGGGIGHVGHSRNGNISKNFILFNESFNQVGVQNGGGLSIEGEVIGGATIGTGNVTVDSNQIQGNFARAGHGGGVRLQSVNGLDAARGANNRWRVTMTNNIIVNNVAGWSGGGISLADTINSRIINNTVASNDSVGITGNVFNTVVNGVSTGPVTGVPSPAGISSELTTAALLARLPPAQRAANTVSNPVLRNNIIWQNRSFFFDMSSGVAQLIPSNNWVDAVAAVKPAPLIDQASSGQCVAGAAYWDMGVVGDTSTAVPANVNLHLRPVFSVLTAQIANYPVTGDRYTDPQLVRQYCNGSRAQPGIAFEPGTPFLGPFQLTGAAALDEAGNFVDLQYGPLSLTELANPALVNGNYHLNGPLSPAYNAGSSAANPPPADFDGNVRPQNGVYDIGADEVQ